MAYVASTTAKQNDGAGAAMTINVPTHTDGDVMFLLWNDRNAASAGPAGWTQFTNVPNVTVRAQVFYRVASSEPANYTLTPSGTQGQQAIMLAYSDTVVPSATTSPAPVNDNQLTAAADKDGVGTSTQATGSNPCVGYLVLTMLYINGYSSLAAEPNADPVVTPTAPTTFRAETRIYDTTPQGPVEFMWIGDEVAVTNEPGWTLNWTFQGNPPNTIGTKYLVEQMVLGVVGAGGNVWGWGENDAWHDVA